MITPAFSTVACPDQTLPQIADRAAAFGFEAVELRTFGDASRRFACDPALSSETKVRGIFREAGVDIVSLATSLRFDEPVFPPVIGYLAAGYERSIREAKRAVDLAVAIECPLVRLFGFEYPEREKKSEAMKRITSRLADVADHADKSGIRLVVENGGTFASAAALRELIDAVDHPLLGAAYALAAGRDSGDGLDAALNTLGDRLWLARIKDLDAAGKPVPLGRGTLGAEAFVRALVARKFSGPLVFEWDRAWMPELAPPEQALPEAATMLSNWIGVQSFGAKPGSRPAAAGAR